MSPETLQGLVVFAFVVWIGVNIRLRCEGIRYFLSAMITSALFGLFAYVIAKWQNATDPAAVLIAIVAFEISGSLIPKRSRYIPKSVRRQFKTPKGHELDHKIPFSLGGSNTADNLRPVSRRVNRRKGAKLPWWGI